jgi:hypothetical protein
MRHVSVLTIAFLATAAFSVPIAARPHTQDGASQDSSSQDSSVARAARRNREKKKESSTSPKPTKVITDDDLDRKNFQPGQEGLNVGASPMAETQPPSAKAVAAAEAADERSQHQAKDSAEQNAEVAKLKLEIAEAEKGLDLAQRQLALDQDSYFSQTDYAHDTAGKAKIDSERQGVSDREQQVERLKSRLAALAESKGQRKSDQAQPATPPQTENAPSAPPQR